MQVADADTDGPMSHSSPYRAILSGVSTLSGAGFQPFNSVVVCCGGEKERVSQACGSGLTCRVIDGFDVGSNTTLVWLQRHICWRRPCVDEQTMQVRRSSSNEDTSEVAHRGSITLWATYLSEAPSRVDDYISSVVCDPRVATYISSRLMGEATAHGAKRHNAHGAGVHFQAA